MALDIVQTPKTLTLTSGLLVSLTSLKLSTWLSNGHFILMWPKQKGRPHPDSVLSSRTSYWGSVSTHGVTVPHLLLPAS